jgi:hypothetical protein
MTGRRETDHEFKTRMAAEGRAIYVPGKTAEEVTAERARKEKPRPVTLDLSEDQLAQLDTALPDAMKLIQDAGAMLDFMADQLFSGNIDIEDHRAWSAMRLSARALRLAGERELMILDTLDARLRTARKSAAKGGVE